MCMESLKDVHHDCPNCHVRMGTRKGGDWNVIEFHQMIIQLMNTHIKPSVLIYSMVNYNKKGYFPKNMYHIQCFIDPSSEGKSCRKKRKILSKENNLLVIWDLLLQLWRHLLKAWLAIRQQVQVWKYIPLTISQIPYNSSLFNLTLCHIMCHNNKFIVIPIFEKITEITS